MFEELGDPKLVIKFQQFCGLKWKDVHCEHSSAVNSAHGPDTLTNGTAEKPNCNGAVIHGQKNESKCEYTYNPFVHLLFHVSSALGDEQVLIATLSFVFWNFDPWAVMRLYLTLALSLYLGQGAKDVLMSPRPTSPPVVRVERKYADEYSMPSTHAMMGVVVPFSLIYFTHERNDYPIMPALIAGAVCCFLVSMSRVYLGMHTIKDVLAGFIFECAIMITVLPYMNELAVEKWCQTSSNVFFTAFILPAILLLFYPTSTPTTFNTYSDVAMVLGVVTGAIIALRYSAANEDLMLEFSARKQGMSGFQLIWLYNVRYAVGTTLLALTRILVKWCVTTVLANVVPSSMIMKPLGYKRFVEVPHKIITYGMVAFNCVYIAPKLFQHCGV